MSDAWPICRHMAAAFGSAWRYDASDAVEVVDAGYSPSGSPKMLCNPSRGVRRGCRASYITWAWHWAAVLDRVSHDGSCFRSARTRCCGPFGRVRPNDARRCRSLVSTIGRGSAVIVTERLFAISSSVASSMSCPTGRPRQSKRGFLHGRRFASCRAIAAADTVRRSPALSPPIHALDPPSARRRWHLMENASSAFLEAVRRSATCLGVEINPALLTRAERIQYEGFLRREEADAVIRSLSGEGVPIKEIVRRTGRSRQAVRRVVRGQSNDVFRVRMSSLEPWLAGLDEEWRAGCRNGAELWRRLKATGFGGSLRVVSEWTTRRRRAEAGPNCAPRKCPSSRVIARMMTIARDQLSKEDAVTIATIESSVPALVAARDLLDRFQAMVRQRKAADLPSWLQDAASSLLASFATGLKADEKAVAAALVEPWSNGQTEGQITKLKLVKRQMYGRAKLDLLRARLLGAGDSTRNLHRD